MPIFDWFKAGFLYGGPNNNRIETCEDFEEKELDEICQCGHPRRDHKMCCQGCSNCNCLKFGYPTEQVGVDSELEDDFDCDDFDNAEYHEICANCGHTRSSHKKCTLGCLECDCQMFDYDEEDIDVLGDDELIF